MCSKIICVIRIIVPSIICMLFSLEAYAQQISIVSPCEIETGPTDFVELFEELAIGVDSINRGTRISTPQSRLSKWEMPIKFVFSNDPGEEERDHVQRYSKYLQNFTVHEMSLRELRGNIMIIVDYSPFEAVKGELSQEVQKRMLFNDQELLYLNGRYNNLALDKCYTRLFTDYFESESPKKFFVSLHWWSNSDRRQFANGRKVKMPRTRDVQIFRNLRESKFSSVHHQYKWEDFLPFT